MACLIDANKIVFQVKDLGELFLRPGAYAKCCVGLDGSLGGAGGGRQVGPRSNFQGFHDRYDAYTVRGRQQLWL